VGAGLAPAAQLLVGLAQGIVGVGTGRVDPDQLLGGTRGLPLDPDTPRSTLIDPASGFDRLAGGSGNDLVYGDDGRDSIDGGPGADTVYGGRRGDRLDGGPGRDRLDGGPGYDDVRARDGERDRINGGTGSDQAEIDPGLDRTIGVESLLPGA